MEIDSQLFYSDMLSDEQNGPGESSISSNLYVNAKGATISEKAAIRAILDRHYAEIRADLLNIGRYL
jgi:hypothetical protein